MKKKRLYAYLALGLCGSLSLLAGAAAQPVPIGDEKDDRETPVASKTAGNEIVQTFPSNDVMRTAWKVHWATSSGHGLYIQDAWFKRSPADPWMQVLGDARLSEAFVPYHRGSPRFWDVSYNFPLCPATKDDAGPAGHLLATAPGRAPTVVKEVRDRGLMWKDGRGVRRGETLLVWGTLSAANYRYVIEFGFQDTGTITFRCGSTGHNYGGSEYVGHTHNSLWRVDVNLDGPNNNSVLLCEHIEPGTDDNKTARTQTTLLKTEGPIDWDPVKFTSLRVINTQRKNARRQPLAYDVINRRMGNSRHFGGDKEDCTLHDFWVTRASPKELHYARVQEYVKAERPIVNTDVVLWLSTPGHHEPRSEDGEMKGNRFDGVTPIMWCGFDLRPRDIFDRSPMVP